MQLHPVANSENKHCMLVVKKKTKGYDKDEEKMLNFNLKKNKQTCKPTQCAFLQKDIFLL